MYGSIFALFKKSTIILRTLFFTVIFEKHWDVKNLCYFEYDACAAHTTRNTLCLKFFKKERLQDSRGRQHSNTWRTSSAVRISGTELTKLSATHHILLNLQLLINRFSWYWITSCKENFSIFNKVRKTSFAASPPISGPQHHSNKYISKNSSKNHCIGNILRNYNTVSHGYNAAQSRLFFITRISVTWKPTHEHFLSLSLLPDVWTYCFLSIS